MKNFYFLIILLISCFSYQSQAQSLTQETVEAFEKACDYDEKGDYANAARYCRYAAEHWHAWAQYALANYYLEGKGVPVDLKEAFKWTLESAKDNAYPPSRWGDEYLTLARFY